LRPADRIDQRALLFSDHRQLPPVGEAVGARFGTKSRSHLDEIVPQAADSPIIAVTTMIRTQHGGRVDCSWCSHTARTLQGGL
jgi:hypothetical protein